MRKKSYYLLLGALFFLLSPTLWPQAEPSTIQQQPVPKNWKNTVFDIAPELTDEKDRALRHARGALFDDPTGRKRPLDTPKDARTGHGSSAGFPLRIPALPASETDTVLVGEVVSFQPYFSNDRTSIYHELTVRIEQVLKDGSSIAKENGSIVIFGEGGALRLPNGKVAKQFVPPPVENDIRVGGRYVLFLLYRREVEAFLVWKPWELRTGHAIPMARSDIRDAETGSSPYGGMNGAAFLNEVRNSVANSAATVPAPGQVIAPTLRDEVRKNGFAWQISYPEDRALATFDLLISRSDLILRGRVVDEKTRLSKDELSVLTDYTVEVADLLKDPRHLTSVGGRLVVTKSGGNLLLEGKPVRIDTPNFPPIPWLTPHVFFIQRSDSADAQYYFTGVGIGVLAIENRKISCQGRERQRHPATRGLCGKAESEFLQFLKEKMR